MISIERYFTNNELLAKIPMSFLIMGGFMFIVNVIALTLMTQKKESLLINEITDESKSLLTLGEAVKLPHLYMMAVISSFYEIPTSIFGANYKSYGQMFIKDDQFLTLMNSISSILNIFLRLLWGLIIDKLSFKVFAKILFI